MRDASGTLRTLTRIRMRDAAGTLRTITRVRMRDPDNVLRIVYDSTGASTFDVSASPETVAGFGIGTAITAAATATPSGGTGPYSYAWSRLDYTHPTVAPTADTAAAATTTFTQTTMDADAIYSSTWRVTVTDSSVPALTATDDVTANFADVS